MNHLPNAERLYRKIFPIVTAVVMGLALGGCGGKLPGTLTQANLDKIQPDMSAVEVKGVLGEPTDSTTEPIPIVGGTKTTYTYSDSNGDHVVIVLKNDKVQTKEGHFAGS